MNNHLLLSRGSRVLMATGFVYGDHWFSTPPHKFDLPWPIAKKISHRWFRREQLLRNQSWWKSAHGGLLGKCVKYNQIFIYLFIPSVGRFRAWWRKWRGLVQGHAFLGFIYIVVHSTTTTTTTTTVLRLCGICPGKPGWAGTRRNIHPLLSS